MGKRDFDYRREGWHPSSASDTAVSSSSTSDDHWGCCVWLAFHAIQAIMVAICLVAAIASFFFAEQAATHSEGYDLAFAISVSMMLGGFLAIFAAITRCWWLLVLAFLPPVWAYASQGYYDTESFVTLTFIFDGCVVLFAVGLVVARCRQDLARLPVDGEEDLEDVDNASDKRPSRSGRNRRAPMVREIV